MISNIIRSIFNFFGANLKETNISWLQVFLYGLFPFGQLFARINLLNGSLDRAWLLLLNFPPFSFIPMIMMKFGLIKEGAGINPYDYNIYLPILLHLLMNYALGNFFNTENLFNITYMLLLVGSTAGVLIYRMTKNCEFKSEHIGKTIIDTAKIISMAELLPFITMWIPIVGNIFTMLISAPGIGPIIYEILWGAGFVFAYILVNMFNQHNMNQFCNSPFFGTPNDQLIFIYSLLALVSIKLFNSFFS
jgi:hypothetical protein